MFASFCILVIASFDSTIGCLLGATPAALEANPKDSLIGFLVAASAVLSDSNTTLASLIVVALSNEAITWTFCDSVKFLALKILFN